MAKVVWNQFGTVEDNAILFTELNFSFYLSGGISTTKININVQFWKWILICNIWLEYL